MKSDAAQNTFKFLIGAMLGCGASIIVLRTVGAHPVLIAAVSAVAAIVAGFLGVRVFDVGGKIRLVPEGEEDRLRPTEEVKMVIGFVLLGAILGLLIG